MCYNFQQLENARRKRYRYWNEQNRLRDLEEKINNEMPPEQYHVSGFSHPKIVVYLNDDPYYPSVLQWGLVPFWVKEITQAKQIWNKTLNAKGETMFELPSFKEPAKNKRCLIYVNGFFEHHHFNGKAYPYFIHRKDMEPMILGGIWSSWKNPEDSAEWKTFSIVTTSANSLMTRIHNNPDKEGPRMPLILPESVADEWLMPIKNDSDKQFIKSMIQPFNPDEMTAHTVGVLSGKNYIGNRPEVTNHIEYPGLE